MTKKALAILLTLVIIFMFLPEDVLASEFSDMPDDWSTTALEHAVYNGLLNGENGQIRPDDNLTRAQMAAIINRAFKSTAMADLSEYTDVFPDKWYYDDMAKAVQMGIFTGYNNKLNPDNSITRQEVFVVLARAFKIPASDQDVLNGFEDAGAISPWAVDATSALIEAGYVNGNNGKINPLSYITRAEFAQMMYNMAKVYISTDGTYTSISAGNVIINTPDITLKDVNIAGDLIIGDGVGDGDVTLENVNVSGRLIIRGGGLNSIKILGTSNMQNIVIARVDGQVRVYTEDGTVVGEVIVDGKDDVLIEGSVSAVTILANDVTVTAKNAMIDDAVIEGDNSKLIVESDSSIDSLTVEAANTKIEVNGEITDVIVNEESAEISGSGSVETVQANADNITVTTDDTLVTAAEGTTGVIAGTQEVSEGTTQNTTPSSTGTETSGTDSSGCSISIDQTAINASNETAMSFTFSSAVISADYTYSIDDTNGGTATVTGSGTIATATDQVTGIDVSSLDDDTLTLTVTITGQTNQTDSVVKDTVVPSGYSVSIDQSAINSSNKTALSFTFAGAEVGTDYTYSIDDTNGGTSPVTGSGTIATATDQISSIDVSGLDDDTLILTVYLTDSYGNEGGSTTDTVVKDTVSPSGYSVSIDQSAINSSNKTALSFTFTGAEVGTDYTYSIDDTNGATSAVTGSGAIVTATDQISSIDVSGLDDDTLILTVYLTDSYGNEGGSTTDTVVKDTVSPSGYSVSIDQSAINSSNKTALSFTFAGAEVGTDYNYSIDDTNGGTSPVTGSGTIATATDQISSIDVSGLDDDTLILTVYLTDSYGNEGGSTTDTVVKDTVSPSGYSVSIDQSAINSSNKTALSFTFTGAEVGTDYTYSIDDTNGGTTAVTGSGAIVTATDQISSIDVSGLDDDTLTLTVYLTDSYGNEGGSTTDTVVKDTVSPSGYSVSIDQSAINSANETAMSFTFSSAEFGASYAYSIDDTNGATSAVTGSGTFATATDQISSIDVSGLDDDTLTLTVYLTDSSGNQGGDTTDTVTKETVAPSGYSVNFNQSTIISSNETAISFTFAGAEVGADYNYSIDDTNGGTTAVTGSGAIVTATDQISSIDVSGLDDDTLTLTVYLTDSYGNEGGSTTDTVAKDTAVPSGYSVSIDQSAINSTNKTAMSFTFSSAEVGASYAYSIDDTNGATSAVTGSGTIATATDQISSIDVSGLDDDTLTLTVYLTDSYGNQGGDTTDTVEKETVAPSGYSVNFDQSTVIPSNEIAISFTFAGAEVGTTYTYSIDDTNGATSAVTGSGTIATATDQISSIDVSGLDDGTLNLSVTLTDAAGNTGTTATDSVTKDATAPTNASGYPKADTVSTVGFTVRAKTDEDGTAYYVVLADGASAPTAAEVKAGTASGGGAALASGSIALTANTEGSDAVSGLSGQTDYDVYMVSEDSSNNLQSSPIKVDVTTLDGTAPSNAAGYPKADTATTDGFTVRAKINEAGTAYYVVLADGASAPTAAEVKAGTASGGGAALASGSIALTANTEGSDAVSGLSGQTDYDVYMVSEDSSNNLQSSPIKVDVTTTSIPSSLTVTATGPWAPYSENGTYSKQASLYNGKPQYHYNDGTYDYDIFWDGSKWVLDTGFVLHYNNTSSDIPPTTGWVSTDGVSSMSLSY